MLWEGLKKWRRYFATEAILRHCWLREMPSFSMRERKVFLLMPSRSAAPSGPPSTQSVSRNACDRARPLRVFLTLRPRRRIL